ncbi:MAG: NAD-binding protein [Myxococcales bacterium]|nr:NAD-binding protein [Myxococcales bacterium]MCB9755225.1 NAD-binding protein [Myxococcales bacterium]
MPPLPSSAAERLVRRRDASRAQTALLVVLLVTSPIVVVAVLVYRAALGLSWVDAVYFVVTTITTVGYGDIALGSAPAWLKLFGVFIMLSGAASIAAVFGLITEFIVRRELVNLLHRSENNMRDHIVLCGLGKVGHRTLAHLLALKESVVAVEVSSDCRFVEEAAHQGVDVIIGDMRNESTLERCRVEHAKAIVAVSDDDLANIEAVVHARSVNPKIRVVVRLFDQSLARKLAATMDFGGAFSMSHLAAPAFAMAAVDPAIVSSFYVKDQLMLNVELVVAAGSRLDGAGAEIIERFGGASVLFHETPDGAHRFHPRHDLVFGAGDKLIVSTTQDRLRELHALNEAR